MTVESKNFTLLLPALDEEDALPDLFAEIPFEELESKGWFCNVLLVDGGSKDSTREIAKNLGCEVIEQGSEKGKGAGMRIAFEHFIKTDSNALVMIDADGTYSPNDICKLLDNLEGNDVVIGSGAQIIGPIKVGNGSRIAKSTRRP